MAAVTFCVHTGIKRFLDTARITILKQSIVVVNGAMRRRDGQLSNLLACPIIELSVRDAPATLETTVPR